MRAILSAKAVWAAVKDADMAENLQTASIISRKSQGYIEICWSGSADVLGPTESKGARGTGGVEEASDVGSGAVTARAVDTGIWGSSVGTTGGG